MKEARYPLGLCVHIVSLFEGHVVSSRRSSQDDEGQLKVNRGLCFKIMAKWVIMAKWAIMVKGVIMVTQLNTSHPHVPIHAATIDV